MTFTACPPDLAESAARHRTPNRYRRQLPRADKRSTNTCRGLRFSETDQWVPRSCQSMRQAPGRLRPAGE